LDFLNWPRNSGRSPSGGKSPAGSVQIENFTWKELSSSEGVGVCFSVLGVEIAVESIHGSLKDEAAVRAAFKVTLDLGLYNRRQAPF
jgi:hypothetical protein